MTNKEGERFSTIVFAFFLLFVGLVGAAMLMSGIESKVWHWSTFKTASIVVAVLLILIGTWKFTEDENGIRKKEKRI